MLEIRKVDRVPNARIRDLCGVTNGVDERIEGALRLFGHVEKMEKDRIAERVYIGECACSYLLRRPRKR